MSTIYTIIFNDYVDPKDITDPVVRAQYAQALKEYEQNSDLVMRASELRKLADEFNGAVCITSQMHTAHRRMMSNDSENT